MRQNEHGPETGKPSSGPSLGRFIYTLQSLIQPWLLQPSESARQPDKSPRTAKRFWSVIAALVVAALACNLPGASDTLVIRLSRIFGDPAATPQAQALVCDQAEMTTVSLGPEREQQEQQPTARQPQEDDAPAESERPTTAPVATEAGGERADGQETPTEAPTLPATADIGPMESTFFLELPFPYDGGNQNFGGTDEQFIQASRRTANGGRVNSFFDHLVPLYPSEHDGRESSDPPEAGRVLRYDGQLSENIYYSGHPAYDYSTFEPRRATTPVFAAADGVVSSVGECCGGALVVRIRHEIEGIGTYRTTYMHLAPDEHFEAAKSLQGQPVEAGSRIGTMGNTGWSTGHHLHFEVRFDANQDGRFNLSEVVDPYGFVPGEQYEQDPWVQRSSGAAESRYLWRHPLGSQGQALANGAGEMSVSPAVGGGDRSGTFCAPPNSLPSSGTVTVVSSPDPAAEPGRAGSGTGFSVTVTDSAGSPIDRLDPAPILGLPLAETRLRVFVPGSAAVYWYSPDRAEWQPVPASIDWESGLLLVEIARTGWYALLGEPVEDHYRPRTEILLDGPTSPAGTFYEQVTVTLRSEDPSGIERIDYSLDNGTTWHRYTGPFTLDRSGIPEELHEGTEPSEVFGGGPGRHLVLASAVDGAGNVEEPPAFRLITIDPREAPEAHTTPETTPSTGDLPSINFNADQYTVQQGTCTRLRWNVENAEMIALEGEEVSAVDSEQICPETTTSYELAASNPEGERTKTVRIEVVDAPTLTPTQAPQPPAAPSDLSITNKVCNGGYSVTLGWNDNASGETGYRVYRDNSLIASLPANSESYTDNPPGTGPYVYEVEAFNSAGSSPRDAVNESGCLF